MSPNRSEGAIATKLQKANHRLKVAQMGLQIEQRGQKLCLRGTLPPRPGSSRLNPHQQRISLGLPATASGIQQAEQEAKVIAVQIIQNTFDWQTYLPVSGGKRLSQMDLPETIEAFRVSYLSNSDAAHQSSALATWTTAYLPYLRKLEAIATQRPTLSMAEAIYTTVTSTREHSRSRQICCTALSAFAQFLNLELPRDLKSYWGRYGNSKTKPRSLPTDAEILAAVEKIPNPGWRFVYGIMATYGLRNHEVFFCDYQSLAQGTRNASIEVSALTKTGAHETWPFYPDWIEHFNLRNICLPDINTNLKTTTLQRIGQTVSVQFRRYGIPFKPYDLRHAWAVRTIHVGLSDTVAARMMGHSVAVHTRTYHRWLTRRDQQQAVEAALQRIERL